MEHKATIVAFTGYGEPMETQDKAIPTLKPGEILVKNLYATICGSDIHTYCGLRTEKVPTILGHEIVGEITAFHQDSPLNDYLGEVLQIGDRVTWSIFASDPSSLSSIAGIPQKGAGLFKYGHAQITSDDILHGGFATHTIIKRGTAVIKIDKNIAPAVAATINCAIATVAGAVRLAGTIENKKILITGSGLLGIVCSAMCSTLGASNIYMADVNVQRLEMAKAFGTNSTCLLTQQNALPADIDIAFDMSGAPDAMEAGIGALAIGGTAIWIGAVFKTRPVNVDPESIIRKIITIKGLHNYNYEDFVAAVNFISKHHQKFPFEKLISAEFSLSEVQSAFEYAVEHKPIRVGINISKSNF